MEVAQLYVRQLKSSVGTPVRQLYDFQKRNIDAAKEEVFTLRLPIAELYLHNRSMQRVVEPGRYELLVGASSADIRLRDTLNVIGLSSQKTIVNTARQTSSNPQFNLSSTAKTIQVAGVVRNVQAFLLAGVKVKVDGKTVQTNVRGEYSLTARIGSTLQFILPGYRTETLMVKENGLFDVELTPETP